MNSHLQLGFDNWLRRNQHAELHRRRQSDLCMSTFTPCKGQTACRDDGERCITCGRSFAEIEQTRSLIDALTELAISQGYDNVEEFAGYVAGKVVKKVRHRRGGT